MLADEFLAISGGNYRQQQIPLLPGYHDDVDHPTPPPLSNHPRGPMSRDLIWGEEVDFTRNYVNYE